MSRDESAKAVIAQPTTKVAAQQSGPAVRHLTQNDLAQRWRMSGRTLEAWRLFGQGPQFMRIGGKILYRICDIQAFEEQQLRTRTGFPRKQDPGSVAE